MDKEKFITIAIGLIVGVATAVGYFAVTKIVPQLGKKNPVEIITPKPQTTPLPQPSPATTNATKLSLDLPVDNSATKDSTSTVSGQTSSNATLIIFSNAEQKIATAEANGKFNESLRLEEGLNVISVTAIGEKNNPGIIFRNVTLEINP